MQLFNKLKNIKSILNAKAQILKEQAGDKEKYDAYQRKNVIVRFFSRTFSWQTKAMLARHYYWLIDPVISEYLQIYDEFKEEQEKFNKEWSAFWKSQITSIEQSVSQEDFREKNPIPKEILSKLDQKFNTWGMADHLTIYKKFSDRINPQLSKIANINSSLSFIYSFQDKIFDRDEKKLYKPVLITNRDIHNFKQKIDVKCNSRGWTAFLDKFKNLDTLFKIKMLELRNKLINPPEKIADALPPEPPKNLRVNDSQIPEASKKVTELPQSLKKAGLSDHQILGVPKNASEKQIMDAFNKQILLYHPDKNMQNQRRANKITRQLIKIKNRLLIRNRAETIFYHHSKEHERAACQNNNSGS